MAQTTDLGVRRLAHVALRSPDPERLAAYYERNVGLAWVDDARATGPMRLTTDSHPHCLELHAGEPRLDHAAFEVPDAGVAASLLRRDGDVDVENVEAPGWETAAQLRDPEGNAIRLVSGSRPSGTLSAGSRVMRPRKIGHVGIKAKDLSRLVDFYTTRLGFRLSDWIGDQVVFLRCNPDHHALVFVSEPSAVCAIHHVAYEVASWEQFAAQADVLAANGVAVGWGPGRHGPSRNYFMYFDDDDGNRIEWMAGVRLIYDEAGHVPRVFDPALPNTWNVWGPQAPPEFLRGLGPARRSPVA